MYIIIIYLVAVSMCLSIHLELSTGKSPGKWRLFTIISGGFLVHCCCKPMSCSKRGTDQLNDRANWSVSWFVSMCQHIFHIDQPSSIIFNHQSSYSVAMASFLLPIFPSQLTNPPGPDTRPLPGRAITPSSSATATGRAALWFRGGPGRKWADQGELIMASWRFRTIKFCGLNI